MVCAMSIWTVHLARPCGRPTGHSVTFKSVLGAEIAIRARTAHDGCDRQSYVHGTGELTGITASPGYVEQQLFATTSARSKLDVLERANSTHTFLWKVYGHLAMPSGHGERCSNVYTVMCRLTRDGVEINASSITKPGTEHVSTSQAPEACKRGVAEQSYAYHSDCAAENAWCLVTSGSPGGSGSNPR